MKKIFKILIGIFFFFLALIIVLPIAFEDKILDIVKKTANNNLDATLDFAEGDLSIFSSFPSTKVSLKDVSILSNAPFKGDTLFSAKAISLKMPLIDLFKSSSDIRITNVTIDASMTTLKADKNGNVNYDIAKKDDASDRGEGNSNSIQLKLASYEISNSEVLYQDDSNNLKFHLSDINHSGSGNLSADVSTLKTVSSALISLEMDSIAYLKNNALKLDAVFEIDLNTNTYRFLENELVLNQLPLTVDGYVKVNETNQELKLSFKTPSSDFKNFLALIPEVYSKNIEGVTTTGNFDVNGRIEGILDDTYIPKINIAIKSNNASFKYPTLSKSLKNINIKTNITNETGLAKNTYITIDTLNFKIDNEVFNARAELREITENMKVAASLKGIINLASLEQIYPAEAFKGIKGILDADASTKFDMASIETKQYEKTTTTGRFKVVDFEYISSEFKSPLKIAKADVTFMPNMVNLNNFDAQLGETDFAASGTINNLLGFLFNKENITGRFNILSEKFSVNDFMISENEEASEEGGQEKESGQERVKIPSFLDCTIDAKATTVLYDNVTLKNVSATMFIKDEKVTLKNVTSTVFGGSLGLNGNVSTKNDISKFEMNLDASKFDISQSFTQLELFQSLAPIAKAISGKIDANISLSGNLSNDLTPDLNSLNGTLIGQILGSKITTTQSPLLQKLEQNLTFIDVEKLNLENLKTALTFKDGKVALKPFTLNYKDIEIAIAGGHGFDRSLAYDAVFNVPASYLGKEAGKLIAQLNDQEMKQIKVPVSALIKGKFSNPSITTDLKAAVANLSKQLANNQKEKLVNQGKDKLKDALGGLLGGQQKDSTKVDSLKKDPAKEAAKGLLNDLFKRTKKTKDTVN